MSERTSSEIRGRDEAPARSPEQTARAIDSFYDNAETFVSGMGRIVGVDTSVPSGGIEGNAQRMSNVPQLSPPAQRALPSPQPARFEIVEVKAYAITNGKQSLQFSTREAAEEVLAELRKAGAA